jgi:putative zinc finger protein
MKCKAIEKLIPLYVEGDLESSETTAVTTHLKVCGSCSELARQFVDSQNWLRSPTVAEAGSRFFEDLRAEVLAEVERRERIDPPSHLLPSRWRGPSAWATAFMILIAIGLVFYLTFQRTTGVSNEDQAQDIEKAQVEEHAASDSGGSSIAAGGSNIPAGGPKRAGNRHVLARPGVLVQPPTLAYVDPDSILRNAIASVPPAEIAFDGSAHQEIPLLAQDEGLVNSEDEDGFPTSWSWLSQSADSSWKRGSGSRTTTRIEIQTADPAVRIIWFAPAEKGVRPSTTDTD